MPELSKAEEMVLLAIWRLREKAYGVSIHRQILADTGKDYTYGTLYGLLRQLDHKGYVEKAKGDPIPRKGGRGKTFFKLRKNGILALEEARRLHRRLWRDISDLSPDRE